MSAALRTLAFLLAAGAALLAAAPGHAQPVPPPLTAHIFFPDGTPADGVFPAGVPIPIIVQLENTSGARVATTDRFSSTEFFRRLFFTDPQGGTVINKVEEKIHDYSRVFMCLSRGKVLLTTAIPVVPVEVLAGPADPGGAFFLEFEIDDARRFYDLSRPGTYTVNARIPLMVFNLSDPAGVLADCDQVPGQVANVGTVASRSELILVSNTLSFTVAGDPPQPPVTAATVSPAPNAAGWLQQPATVSFSATSPSDVPIQRIVVQTSGAQKGQTNLTGSQGSVTISEDGETSVGYHAEDVGGNNEEPQSLVVRVDGTPPLITVTTPAPNASFTQGQVVNAAYACTDTASGVATCTGSVPNGTPIDTSTPGGKTFTVNATDVAGNAAAPASVEYMVTPAGATDTTPPELTVRCAPPSFSPVVGGRDAGSGVASVTLTGTQGKRQTYTVLDNAGNRLIAVLNVSRNPPAAEMYDVFVESLAYGTQGPAKPTSNNLRCGWEQDKRTGALRRFAQTLKIGGKSGVEVTAQYDAKRDQTQVVVKPTGQKAQKVTRPGFVFLTITTSQGALGFEF